MTSKNPALQIYDAQSRYIHLRECAPVDNEIMKTFSTSRASLARLSDDYFRSVECTETFSLAYCRDLDSENNCIVLL